VSAGIRSALRFSSYGVGVHTVRCVPLANERLHTFCGILGYCMKDRTRAYYCAFSHNFTQEEFDAAPTQLASGSAALRDVHA
jgi:hypothetical protein